jgi:two-component system, NarL family, capsular synthesis sensor histidine kinase RcsC
VLLTQAPAYGSFNRDPDMRHSMLLVEDRPTIRFALSDYFRSRGWEVDCAASLDEAEAVLERRRFTVVMADLSLSEPGSTDGLELTRRVRHEWPGTRTIILTAYGTAETERVARRIGVDAFLHKPAPLAELARVADALAGRDDACSQPGPPREG